ncbi:MAG: metallophosphoesterase [Lachnospiraceae bacterium]|nr:metallophosphoesterase [Lachnospiraceae bacterium]
MTSETAKNFFSRRKKWLYWGGIIVALLCFFYYENRHLVVTEFTYVNESAENFPDGYRIVQISDLHNAVFGRNQRALMDRITELAPDMVVITGDIVDSNHTDIDVAIDLVVQLVGLCPVYYVTGNHEYWLDEGDRRRLFEEMEQAGAILLFNEAVTVNASGGTFDLIGLDDKSLADDTLKALLSECNSETLNIVLAHEPQYIENYAVADADLVLCGHAHGGQFILPLIGPVVAPDQGFFPQYTSGAYRMEDTTMFVSRGLGNSIIPVRLFNDPEVVCIDLAAGH